MVGGKKIARWTWADRFDKISALKETEAATEGRFRLRLLRLTAEEYRILCDG